MKIGKNKSLWQLLNENNNIELKKWLINNGKTRKPYCPVLFKDKDNTENDEDKEIEDE